MSDFIRIATNRQHAGLLVLLMFISMNTIFPVRVSAQQDSSVYTPPSLADLDRQQWEQTPPMIRAYAYAKSIRDYPAAIKALNYYLLEDPENRFLTDSLIWLYLQTGNDAAACMIAEKQHELHPDDIFPLEVMAGRAMRQEDFASAIIYYQKLQSLQSSPYTQYQIAALEFRLERFGECMEHLDEILEDPESEGYQIRISTSEASQDVPLKAAAFNVKGNVYEALKQNDQAKEAFKMALEIFPDFKLAQNNLKSIRKKK